MADPLKFWRGARGLSQSKLAKLSETSALTISQLESGKRKARGKTMGKILGALRVSQDEFFQMRETGQPIPTEPAVRTIAKPVAPARVDQGLHLSNLDLELLNRILNLDFNGKIETLKFLQNLA
ncbi:MAG: helix-turn-helix transcriptional regulator [bacterium]